MNKHILLIGMPGAGKSTLGKQLAIAHHCHFYDLDQMIEQVSGTDIQTLFQRDGEAAFRDLEWHTFLSLLEGVPCVIAGGGGLVPSAVDKGYLKPESLHCILLNPSLDRLIQQLSEGSELAKRPLLSQTDDLKGRLTDLMNARMVAYKAWADEEWVNY